MTFFFVLVTLLTLALPAWAVPDERPRGINTLIAVIPKDAPPTFFRDRTTGEAAGFAVDISNEVAKRAGISVTYTFGDNWDEIRDVIARGDADMGPGLTVSAERRGFYAFSEPFEIFTIAFFVRSASGIFELKDGASVGVLRGSVANEFIRGQRDMKLFFYDNIQTGLFDLLAGKIDSFAGPAPVLWRLAMDAGVEEQIKVVGKPLAEVKRAFGVRRDHTALLERLNKALAGFVGSSEYQKLYSKWYGKPKPFFALSKQTIAIVVVLSLMIAGMAAWRHLSIMGLTRRLRREIEERKRTEGSLKESEESYRVLFDQDPLPGWIYDTETFRFLLVNNAAQKHYGYSMEEFAAMTIRDIRPAEEVGKLLSYSTEITDRPAVSGIWRHRKKDGSLIHVEINSHPVLFNGRKARRVIVKDVTERKRAEEEREQFFRFFQTSADIMVIADPNGAFLKTNPACSELLGFSEAELVAKPFIEFVHPDDKQSTLDEMAKQIQRGSSLNFENRYRCKDGSFKWLSWRAMFNKKEGITYATARDITERKQLAERLTDAQAIAKLGNWEYEPASGRLWWSDEVYRILGFVPESPPLSLNRFFELVHPDDRKKLREQIESALPSRSDYRVRLPDGTEKYLHEEVEVEQGENGKLLRFWGTVQDISDRKQAEEKILRSLKEKEVLLKEIHHRVKNNMQVIYSLLNLQAKSVKDEKVRAMFEESRNRVNSMSLIHEKLYRAVDLAHVDFKEYLQNLVRGVADTYKRRDVVLSVDMEPLALDVNLGIPCGLIVNELVSNCLKYAFPEGRTGMVTVGIRKKDEGTFVLSVADNGIGFPSTVDFRNTQSLGLQLVIVLTGQIQGTIELSNGQGTTFSITFPAEPESKGEVNG
jgi:PAS domain S-box-containing protein